MRFSWRSALLAPFPVPAVCCAVLGVLQSDHPVLAFLITLVPACIISYGTMFALFLPCLYILSQFQPLTGLKVCLVGFVLGAAVDVLVTLMMWKSSGPDSGPPTEPFFTFFVRFSVDPDGGISAGWAANGGAVLAAGGAAVRSANRGAGLGLFGLASRLPG
jgi:hypothetical protein